MEAKWNHGLEDITCIISYKKQIASPGSMQDTGSLGLVHWDDPEGWYGGEVGEGFTKMGSIKDRNGMDLTEPEDIKKRWQEYTELYKKDLHNQDNHTRWCDHSPRARHPG